METVLVTGAAGFIGARVTEMLLKQEISVIGIDNLNDYYDPALKQARLDRLTRNQNFKFKLGNLEDAGFIQSVFAESEFHRVIHLGAQAGVRYSLVNPASYIQSNLVGTGVILEACRHAETPHLVYASSSSVYGMNSKMPFSVQDQVNHPVSLYAATKRANELMAHTYSHLFRLPTTGLRFFTVYGPWGRPDMAPMIFANALTQGKPIRVFNHGKMKRDFTFIDDIAEGVIRVSEKPPTGIVGFDASQSGPGVSSAPFKVYNIGNNQPVELMRFIELMEGAFGTKANLQFEDMKPGDVVATYADVDDLKNDFGWQPTTSIEDGVAQFANWFKMFYQP